MDNSRGYAESYREVIHEDAINVGGFTKAPDCAFCVGRTRKFFVEAKKPAVHIKEDIPPHLPVAPLCLVGQPAVVHPHRLRGNRGLRLPREGPR